MITLLTNQVQHCIETSACDHVEFQPEALGPWGQRRRPLYDLLGGLVVAYPRWRFALTGSHEALALLALIADIPLRVATEFVFVHQGATTDPGAVRLGFEPKLS